MKNKTKKEKETRRINGKKVTLDKKTMEFAVILALLLVSLFILTYFIFPDLFQLNNGASANATLNPISVTVVGSQNVNLTKDRALCLGTFGIDQTATVYIYSDACTFSKEMTPLVTELQNKGYKFFLANTNNATAMNAVSTCLSDVAGLGYTPEFVCPRTGKNYVGVFVSPEDLIRFVNNCR